jgi:hypothetical protein
MCDRKACDVEGARQDVCVVACLLQALAMGKSSCIAARLDEDNGSWNIPWKRVVMEASGVTGDDRGALDEGHHLFSMTRLACFSGWGSR